jgi:hypothetical protein
MSTVVFDVGGGSVMRTTVSQEKSRQKTGRLKPVSDSEPTVTCPKCGTVIKLTESLAGPLVEQTRREYEGRIAQMNADAAKREKELQDREKEITKEKGRVKQQVAEQVEEERVKMTAEETKKNAAIAKREKALRDREADVANALSSVDDQVAEKLKLERSRIIAEEAKKAKRAVSVDLEQRDREVADLQGLVKQQNGRLAETAKKEAELLRKQRELETAKQEQDLTIEQRVRESVAVEGERLRKEAEAAANRKNVEQQRVIDGMQQKLGESQKAEAVFMRQKRELEDKLREVDLRVETGVQEGLAAVRDQARKETADGMNLKLAEKDMKIAGMQKTIAELQQKAEQGSQQVQGEVEELTVEGELRAKFPRDDIVPVAKGKAGGDVLQHVVSMSGYDCGTIIWECKRTRNWSNGWLEKLRADQRAEKAEIAVLVTQALPPNVGAFDYIGDVWVTRPDTAIPVAIALRNSLEEVALARQAATGQHEKTDLLYRYMTGPQFRQRVAAIVEAFNTLRRDLDREKTVFTKQWAKRETQITLAMTSTVGMYGDLQAIAGPTLQQIDGLEMEALDAPDALDVFFGPVDGQGSKG